MYDEVIKLIAKVDSGKKDKYNDVVYEDSFKEVFAELKSVGMREFYQAQTVGFKPEIVFVIADYEDYEGQEIVEHENMRYKVLRTYRKGTSLEITCYGGVRNVNS